jgi:HK97 family phage portal protein
MNLMESQFENVEKKSAREDILADMNISKTKIPFIINPMQRGKDIPQPDNPKLQVQAYVDWVYVCVSRNSSAVANAPLRLFVAKKVPGRKLQVPTRAVTKEKRDRLESFAHLQPWLSKAVEVEEVVDHPFLLLMQNVNAFINRFDLWELTQIYLELTGDAFWYIADDPTLKIPRQIWVLPSQNMKIVTDDKTFVGGYVYDMGTIKIPFDIHEIVHFKFGSPTSMFYGYSPLVAVRKTFVIDQQGQAFEEALLKNNAAPEGVLSTEQELDEEEFERIRKLWKARYSGFGRQGKTVVLSSGLKYEKIAFSPKELAFEKGKKYNREMIAAAFGVPMSKIVTENVNKANAEAGERQWIKDTIEPRLTRIEEKLNEQVIPRYDENLFVAYDDLLPEDTELKIKQRESRLKYFYSSINQERKKDGLDDVSWGDLPLGQGLWLPVGTAPPEQDENVTAAIAQRIYQKIQEIQGKKSAGY